MIRRPRMVASAAVAGAVIAASAAAISPVTQVHAAEATTTVEFKDCEVRELPYTYNTKIADDITWKTPVRLNHPTPISARDTVTTEVELGALPAHVLPQDLTDMYLDIEVRFENGLTSALSFYVSDRRFAAYDADAPLGLDEIEVATSWGEAGIYPQRLKSVWMLFTGTDPNGDWIEYSFACDQQLAPSSLLDVAVYDLAASAEITSQSWEGKQGKRVQLAARNLLSAAPVAGSVAQVWIGGQPAGTLKVDSSGAVVGTVTVPAFVPPGTRVLKVGNGTKAAQSTIQIKAAAARLKATPGKARPGKKLTISGSMFKPGEKVKVVLAGGKGKGSKRFTTTTRATSAGKLKVTVKLKKAAKGSWRVRATGTASGRPAKVGFRVK